MSYEDKDLSNVPPFLVNREILIRGTPEWDVREWARKQAGCKCISIGPIPMLGGKLIDFL